MTFSSSRSLALSQVANKCRHHGGKPCQSVDNKQSTHCSIVTGSVRADGLDGHEYDISAATTQGMNGNGLAWVHI